jgi:hypothetical protein
MDRGDGRAIAQRRGEDGKKLDRIFGQQQHAVIGAELVILEKMGKPVGQRKQGAEGKRFILLDTVDENIVRPRPGVIGQHMMEGFCSDLFDLNHDAGLAPGRKASNPGARNMVKWLV